MVPTKLLHESNVDIATKAFGKDWCEQATIVRIHDPIEIFDATGKDITRFAIACDTETGEVLAFEVDEDGCLSNSRNPPEENWIKNIHPAPLRVVHGFL